MPKKRIIQISNVKSNPFIIHTLNELGGRLKMKIVFSLEKIYLWFVMALEEIIKGR
jgi:hypothetical protein